MPKYRYQHRLELHRLFPVEVRGDTIIITPKGDPAGFAHSNFHVEHAALLALIEKKAYQNVLVDLSGSNYFGAKILEALSEWANRVRAQGGKFAVCELSDDMQELLHIFQLDGEWDQFATRADAVQAIVTETPLQKLRINWRPVGFAACALLLVGLSLVPWSERYQERVNQRDYETVARIWADMQELKAQNAPPTEWRKLQRRAERELNAILPDLNRRAGSEGQQRRLAQQLLYISRDCILKRLLTQRNRLDLSRPTEANYEYFWERASVHMAKAERLLAGEDDADIKYPVPEGYAASPDPPSQVVVIDSPDAGRSNNADNGNKSRQVAPAIAESHRFPADHHDSHDEQ